MEVKLHDEEASGNNSASHEELVKELEQPYFTTLAPAVVGLEKEGVHCYPYEIDAQAANEKEGNKQYKTSAGNETVVENTHEQEPAHGVPARAKTVFKEADQKGRHERGNGEKHEQQPDLVSAQTLLHQEDGIKKVDEVAGTRERGVYEVVQETVSIHSPRDGNIFFRFQKDKSATERFVQLYLVGRECILPTP